MSERKAINKYYPPDFDPSALTRSRKPKKESAAARLQTVRLMAPFSMRCTHCGEFIYRGKKFNARKEPTGDVYLGVKIIRFYIKCPRCAGEIRFKTDPKTADYVTEFGAERNHEPWREKQFEDETLEQRLERLEKDEIKKAEIEEHKKMYGQNATMNLGEDLMADLEARVEATKKEIAIQDELDKLRTRNARIERATTSEGLLDRAHSTVSTDTVESLEDAEDNKQAAAAFVRTSDGELLRTATERDSSSSCVGLFKVKKITKPPAKALSKHLTSQTAGVKKQPIVKSSLGVVVKKKPSLI